MTGYMCMKHYEVENAIGKIFMPDGLPYGIPKAVLDAAVSLAVSGNELVCNLDSVKDFGLRKPLLIYETTAVASVLVKNMEGRNMYLRAYK